jgi:aarF domain-containing kinase
VLFASDVYFYVAKVRQFLGKGKGMDDDLEEQMKRIAKDYGVDMQHSVFEG